MLRATSDALDEAGLAGDFPQDIAVLRRVPYEARADSVMYRPVLAESAHASGWEVHLYDAKTVETRAAGRLAERADEILLGPRAALGPPWTEDHRMALAATIAHGHGGMPRGAFKSCHALRRILLGGYAQGDRGAT
ncbi:MAG: hypothetical protein Q8K79_15995 [Solirubrobacteraceae bacterium]|nr:hypothetical protein [Solirubrobacteraceae bacterium]